MKKYLGLLIVPIVALILLAAAQINNPNTNNGTVTNVTGTSGQITVATGTTTPVISLDPASGSGVDSGTATAYVVTGGAITSLTPTGTLECFLPANANSGTTPTVAFNGLTAKTIVKLTGAAVAISDMVTTQPACVVYNGTTFYLLNPQGATGTGKPVLQALPSFTTGIVSTKLLQNAAGNWANTCTMAAATTCTFAITTSFTTPICIASQSGVAATPIAAECSVSGTTLTITAAASNSSTFAAFVFGNPN